MRGEGVPGAGQGAPVGEDRGGLSGSHEDAVPGVDSLLMELTGGPAGDDDPGGHERSEPAVGRARPHPRPRSRGRGRIRRVARWGEQEIQPLGGEEGARGRGDR